MTRFKRGRQGSRVAVTQSPSDQAAKMRRPSLTQQGRTRSQDQGSPGASPEPAALPRVASEPPMPTEAGADGADEFEHIVPTPRED